MGSFYLDLIECLEILERMKIKEKSPYSARFSSSIGSLQDMDSIRKLVEFQMKEREREREKDIYIYLFIDDFISSLIDIDYILYHFLRNFEISGLQ